MTSIFLKISDICFVCLLVLCLHVSSLVWQCLNQCVISQSNCTWISWISLLWISKISCSLTLSYLGGGGEEFLLVFFFHHPAMPHAIKLELSDFKATSLRHILQVIPVRYNMRCYHGNKITKVTLQNLVQ